MEATERRTAATLRPLELPGLRKYTPARTILVTPMQAQPASTTTIHPLPIRLPATPNKASTTLQPRLTVAATESATVQQARTLLVLLAPLLHLLRRTATTRAVLRWAAAATIIIIRLSSRIQARKGDELRCNVRETHRSTDAHP